MLNAVQPADAALLLVDLHVPGIVENVAAILEKLDEKRISLVADWGGRIPTGFIETPAEVLVEAAGAASGADDDGGAAEPGSAPAAESPDEPPIIASDESEVAMDDPFRSFIPTILVVNKSDLGVDPEEIEVLEELVGAPFPAVAISTTTGEGIDRLGPLLFRGLGIVRIYTKIPGKDADYERPYTVFEGDTVLDVARMIHRDLASNLRFARVWGSGKFDGQQVGKEHPVRDGDVLEIHA